MSLIAREQKVDRQDVRIKILNPIKEEVDDYCHWADMNDISHFFNEAVKLVLIKDKDWPKSKHELTSAKG